MKKLSAQVTISRNNHDEISIEIIDESSGLHIIKVHMTPDQFAKAVTGVSFQHADITNPPTEYIVNNIGKSRETKDFIVDKVKSYKEEDQQDAVMASFNSSGLSADGWELFDDGTRSQQPTDRHRATIRRFV